MYLRGLLFTERLIFCIYLGVNALGSFERYGCGAYMLHDITGHLPRAGI